MLKENREGMVPIVQECDRRRNELAKVWKNHQLKISSEEDERKSMKVKLLGLGE